MMKVDVQVCPECERIWPAISEQGIFVERYAKCFSCVIQEVCEARDERLEAVDYMIENCYDCAGQNPAMSTCVTCGHMGWVAEVPLPIPAPL